VAHNSQTSRCMAAVAARVLNLPQGNWGYHPAGLTLCARKLYIMGSGEVLLV